VCAGSRFTIWDGPGLNTVATPVLATDAAELIWRALETRTTGVLHCCGAEHIDRVGLARRALEAFELPVGLLEVGPPPPGIALADGAVPRDTRLDAAATAARLGAELPSIDGMLQRLWSELESGCLV
jgi:dTDP-4-dehydrorhamnose reductase